MGEAEAVAQISNLAIPQTTSASANYVLTYCSKSVTPMF